MTALTKLTLAAAAAGLIAVLAAPVLLIVLLIPGQTAQDFYQACTTALGPRATVLANPPSTNLSRDEVLLRIVDTATTLGFGRQGATVTVAISLRATGLANAANPTVPDTVRYAHSAVIDGDGVGALGLPSTWGTAAELMTPEVSTALALDRMVDRAPKWRDTDPAELASLITGMPTEAFHTPAQTAQVLLDQHRPTIEIGAPTTRSLPSPSATPTSTAAATASTSALVSLADAQSVASTAPEAASCATALSTPIPGLTDHPNPAGPAIADAAQRHTDTTAQTESQTDTATPPTDSAQFVASVLTDALRQHFPATITGLLEHGHRADAPTAGDLIFTDISANEGPHLVGIAIDPTTMITLLPGRLTPEPIEIGPARLTRRIEVPTP